MPKIQALLPKLKYQLRYLSWLPWLKYKGKKSELNEELMILFKGLSCKAAAQQVGRCWKETFLNVKMKCMANYLYAKRMKNCYSLLVGLISI